MKISFVFTASILLASVAFSALGQGSDIIIRERAKELSRQNNVRQGVAAPTAPPAQPQQTAAKAPTKSPALSHLEADLVAIKQSATVSAEAKTKIANDILALAHKKQLPTALVNGGKSRFDFPYWMAVIGAVWGLALIVVVVKTIRAWPQLRVALEARRARRA